MRLVNHKSVDEAALAWLKEARLQNIPVSGPILQEKVRSFTAALDITGFEVNSSRLFVFNRDLGSPGK